MSRRIQSFLGLILPVFLSFTSAESYGYRLMMGTIQFPSKLHQVPLIRVYASGSKIKTEADNMGKKVTFTVPCSQYKHRFYLLVADKIDYETCETNLITGLKVPQSKRYKLYQMDLKKVDPPTKKSGVPVDPQKIAFKWDTQRVYLDESRRIPDDTIIICYPAHFVEKLFGGSSFEFPTIGLKQNLLELCKNANCDITDISNAILLSTMDIDSIHSSVPQNIKQTENKTLVAPAV